MSLLVRLQHFYLGFYGRPADPGGLSYWIEQANGAFKDRDSDMAAAFGSVDQAEFRALYGETPSIQDFIARVYQNLFGRAAEEEGLVAYARVYDAYLLSGMTADHARAILIARVIDGAMGADRVAITNKAAVAIQFTDELKLKSAAISDMADLVSVQGYFAGDGNDTWRTVAQDQVATFVDFLQTNDSVSDYMATVSNANLGTVPNSEAAGRITYSKFFLLESETNRGEITGSIQIAIEGGEFAGSAGGSIGTVVGTPSGLKAKIIKLSDNLASLTFTGQASPHAFLNSVANIIVSFSDSDLVDIKPSDLEGAVRTNIGIGFIDAAVSVVGSEVKATGAIENSLEINLQTDILTIGSASGRPISGNLSSAVGADLSETAGSNVGAVTVSFTGDGNNNTYQASYMGDIILGLGGDDTLTAGAGIDTFVFSSTAASNGVDVIEAFDVVGGDVLDLSKFLKVTGTSLLAAQTASSDQISWANGDVLVYQGTPITTAAGVAALFDATGSDTTRPFFYPVSDGKAVIITAGVVGDARVWFLVKEQNVTETFDSAISVVSDSEISLVAVLTDVNNLTLAPLTASNFL
jgi:Ca2+-binding RTX toxin-like protein